MDTQFIINKPVTKVFKVFIESSAYKSRVDVTACGISLTQIRNNRVPKMDPCGTPQEIFPKSESLFSIFTRNILSERYDLNHFIVLSENLIALSFCNKIS